MSERTDPWSRTDYRRLIAWERRIQREGPLLERLLGDAPQPSVVDLGCGTGEHVAFFAARGVQAVGLDRSPDMIAKAREHEAGGRAHFVVGELTQAHEVLADRGPFGLALCLGNVLPHLGTEVELARFVAAVDRLLLPRGVLLLQLLGYARIRAQGIRHLPLNVQDTDDGRRVVFLRLVEPEGETHVRFFPTTLEVVPGADPPVRVTRSQELLLRAWSAVDVERALGARGFAVSIAGDVDGGPYEPATSPDLVVVARKPGSP